MKRPINLDLMEIITERSKACYRVLYIVCLAMLYVVKINSSPHEKRNTTFLSHLQSIEWTNKGFIPLFLHFTEKNVS